MKAGEVVCRVSWGTRTGGGMGRWSYRALMVEERVIEELYWRWANPRQ